MRVGLGYDVHQLVENRALILGGVHIEHTHGLLGHSDADVLTHAIMDAILGALGMGDIGRHFPDTSDAYKGISSIVLLDHVVALMKDKAYELGNLDATVVAEAPKLAPYIQDMRTLLARHLNASVDCVNIKATTSEKIGFEGRKEGVSAQAIVLLIKSTGGNHDDVL